MTVRIVTGDCREVLTTLPDASVQMCVTSPPYFGLRDYGTASWDGGDAGCDHSGAKTKSRYDYSLASSPIQDGSRTGTDAPRFKQECPACGAKRIDQQIGLEPDVQTYVAEMVAVFREVRRVLRDDGVLFLSLGDSYNANQGAGFDTNQDGGARKAAAASPRVNTGLAPKQLLGMPWRVAFALQADGWYLRSDIIWAKPNPMPESVRDRPTKAHEYIFLLTKQPRYFWDAEAVREDSVPLTTKHFDRYQGKYSGVKNAPERNDSDNAGNVMGNGHNRNIRSVWTIATAPFAEAHFATFPPALAERCIKAGSATGDVVLDPFGGAGTVGLVADRLGRDAVLIELNPEYAQMARKRITGDAPMFAEVEGS